MKTIISLIIILTVVQVSFCAENENKASWFNYAEQYIQADKEMLVNAAEKKNSFLEDYDSRLAAESKIRELSLPPLSSLEDLLKSRNDMDRKVALVLIMLKKINNEQLTNTILNRYNIKDEFFIKFYSHQALKHLTENQLSKIQNKLLNVYNTENNETVIISAMPTVNTFKD